MMRKFDPPGVPANPNYSHIAQGNGITFIAGQIGVRADGSVPESFDQQIEIVFNKIEDALSAAELTLDNLAKITVFLTDEADLPAYRQTIQRRLPKLAPASSLVFVKALILPALRVEIEAIALG